MTQAIIFIVEDRALARRTIVRQLEHLGRRCRAFASPSEFLDALPQLGSGILLLDIHMPGKSGLQLLDDIPADHGPFAVVILSGSTAIDDAIGAFRRGAVHFLRKPYHQAELVQALTEADAALDQKVHERTRSERAAMIRLSNRELQVLQMIAVGLVSKAIAHELKLSIRTVELHRSRAMSKLGARSASHALALAQELGIISQAGVIN